MSLPWNERVVSFQLNPESATIADIVRMAEELVHKKHCETCKHWSPCNAIDGVCDISIDLPADVPDHWITERKFGCLKWE
jgi:hypothetical protein